MKKRLKPQIENTSLAPSAAIRCENRWLSVDEIAAYLGIKRDTVYKWINEKAMPAHRVGRYWKFRINEIDMWVRAGKAAIQ